MSNLLPSSFPVSIAALIAGLSERPFRRHVLERNLCERDARGFVTKASLETLIGRPVTAEVYLRADRRRDGARAYQRDYRARARQEAANVAV